MHKDKGTSRSARCDTDVSDVIAMKTEYTIERMKEIVREAMKDAGDANTAAQDNGWIQALDWVLTAMTEEEIQAEKEENDEAD